MADISIPGIKSRFDTQKTIESLMEIERIPRKRIEKSIEALKLQKTTWQSLGRRIGSLRDSANQLYSYQNPFNERFALSSDNAVLEASTNRDINNQSHDFIIQQVAKADKFISKPLDKDYRAPAGTYTFQTGDGEVTFKFSGGNLQDLSDTLNRRGQGKIVSSLISIKSGTKSFVIESLATGAENRLQFEADARAFAVAAGLVREVKPEPEITPVKAQARTEALGPEDNVSEEGEALKTGVLSRASIALNEGITPTPSMSIRFEAALRDNQEVLAAEKISIAEAEAARAEQLSRKAALALANAAEAAENQTDSAQDNPDSTAEASGGEESSINGVRPHVWADDRKAAPAWVTPTGGGKKPDNDAAEELAVQQDSQEEEIAEEEIPDGRFPRVDDLNALSLVLDDGTTIHLESLAGSPEWSPVSLNLFDISGGKGVVSLEINNKNTHRDISIRRIEFVDTNPKRNTEPLNAISTAQDAKFLMDGIEIERPVNKIDDIIPGLTLNLHTASETPVNLQIENNTEAVKDAVINMVGTYNRLMAELNVLTRSDDRVISEITYLTEDERSELSEKLGLLSGDTSIQKLRSDLIAIVNASYATADDGAVMLANFGISTDARRGGATGYDPARLRGYLEIEEKTLDEAIANNASGLRQLMGRDTDGDLIVDSGLAYELNRAVRSFTEVGGIIAGKTSGIDSRIAADNRRIDSIDRQLTQKEANLKRQYGQMEDAYNRMEKMSNSLENFGNQNSGRR